MKQRVERYADYLDDHARSEIDNEAAKMLRDLYRVYDAAREVVMAKSHDHKNAAYAELVDIFRGKPGV